MCKQKMQHFYKKCCIFLCKNGRKTSFLSVFCTGIAYTALQKIKMWQMLPYPPHFLSPNACCLFLYCFLCLLFVLHISLLKRLYFHRLCKIIPLKYITPHLGQILYLRLRLNSLGNHRHAKLLGQFYHHL